MKTIKPRRATGLKVYVGRYEFKPPNVDDEPAAFAKAHPRDFKAIVDSLPDDTEFWTNHPYIVDCFDASDVIVCVSTDSRRPLDDMPGFERWGAEMLAGEVWSIYGEDWAE